MLENTANRNNGALERIGIFLHWRWITALAAAKTTKYTPKPHFQFQKSIKKNKGATYEAAI